MTTIYSFTDDRNTVCMLFGWSVYSIGATAMAEILRELIESTFSYLTEQEAPRLQYMLLSVAVTVVVAFQQLHIPTSIGYLLVGIIPGPYTIGPTFNVPKFKTLDEFGVVFLLFTRGAKEKAMTARIHSTLMS